MNSAVTINLEILGADAVAKATRDIMSALTDRRALMAQVAVDSQQFLRKSLISDSRHATAMRLGAAPSGHRAKSAAGVEADSDNDSAFLRIPRNTGLGRAFHDMNIAPRSGKKYLTIPACAATYGKSARDFPQGVLKIGSYQGRFPALVYAADGKPAFWLVKRVRQKQDRSLLPSDAEFGKVASRSATVFIDNLIAKGGAA